MGEQPVGLLQTDSIPQDFASSSSPWEPGLGGRHLGNSFTDGLAHGQHLINVNPEISESGERDDREGRPVSVGSSEVTAMEHGGRGLPHFTAVFSRRCSGFIPTKEAVVVAAWLKDS